MTMTDVDVLDVPMPRPLGLTSRSAIGKRPSRPRAAKAARAFKVDDDGDFVPDSKPKARKARAPTKRKAPAKTKAPKTTERVTGSKRKMGTGDGKTPRKRTKKTAAKGEEVEVANLTELNEANALNGKKLAEQLKPGDRVPDYPASMEKKPLKLEDFYFPADSQGEYLTKKRMKLTGEKPVMTFKADAQINSLYRGRWTGFDENFSTAQFRETVKGMFGDRELKDISAAERKTLEDIINLWSDIRMPTAESGFALEDQVFQHPTNPEEAMFADPYETASLHHELDTARRKYVGERIGQALEDGLSSVEAAVEGAKAAIEYTLNYFTAPITADNVFKYALRPGAEVTDEANLAQVAGRERLKDVYRKLGGTVRELKERLTRDERLQRNWIRELQGSVSPYRKPDATDEELGYQGRSEEEQEMISILGEDFDPSGSNLSILRDEQEPANDNTGNLAEEELEQQEMVETQSLENPQQELEDDNESSDMEVDDEESLVDPADNPFQITEGIEANVDVDVAGEAALEGVEVEEVVEVAAMVIAL